MTDLRHQAAERTGAGTLCGAADGLLADVATNVDCPDCRRIEDAASFASALLASMRKPRIAQAPPRIALMGCELVFPTGERCRRMFDHADKCEPGEVVAISTVTL